MRLIVIISLVLTSFISTAQVHTIERVGDVIQLSIPVAAFSGVVFQKDTIGFLQLGYSFGATVLVTQVLKNTIDKKRPNGKDKAFPSGHTSGAFHGAVFIYRRYGYKYGIPAIAAAAFVGYSRIYGGGGRHDIWDVLGGAAIGSLSSLLFTSPKGNMKPIIKIDLFNNYGAEDLQIGLVYQF